jgi:BetI-type transcriptional repressor, C-terminal
MEAIAADPVVSPLFVQRDEGFRRFLSDAVRRGVVDGSIRSDVDPVAAGAMLVAVLRGAGLQLIGAAPVDDPQAFIREITRTVRTAFSDTRR